MASFAFLGQRRRQITKGEHPKGASDTATPGHLYSTGYKFPPRELPLTRPPDTLSPRRGNRYSRTGKRSLNSDEPAGGKSYSLSLKERAGVRPSFSSH
jgi:hypothetical protein